MEKIFNHEPTRTTRKGRKVSYFLLFIILHSSCSFFTAPKVDVFKEISEEVDWSAAGKLAVTVAIPSGWGGSPQIGTDRCFDNKRTKETPRMGYPFNVEFTPNSGYGFRGWLAFNSDEYDQAAVSALSYEEALASSLNGKSAEIIQGEVTNTGAYPAKITVTAAVDNTRITLVPFCDNRPQIVRSNPPLIPALSAFPFDQKISLWFNMAVKQDSVIMGGTIRVSAVYASGLDNGKPFVKTTDSVNITDGDISQYFEASFPEANLVLLSVKDTYSAEDLQLLNISVEAGPGIQNLNGLTMPQSQTLSYLTNTSAAQKVYEAFNIQASRTGVLSPNSYFSDGQWNNPDTDRRFNSVSAKEENIYKDVYLRFTVTNPEGVAALPNRFTVTEELSGLLSGLPPQSPGSASSTYEDTDAELSLAGGYYTIKHTLKTKSPGIIQMVIRPYRDDTVPENSIIIQDYAAALNAGRFVTVVMDSDPPNGALAELGMEITGGTPSIVDGNSVYTFSADSEMTFTLKNIEKLSDNGYGGILFSAAYNKPWTMDEWNRLQWRVCIREKQSDVEADYYDSGWLFVQTKTYSRIVKNFNNDEIWVSFRDTMGNESKVSAGRIKTIEGMAVPVTDLSATVNTAGNEIALSWTTLTTNGTSGARVYVNGNLHETVDSTGTGASTISKVPTITTTNVRNGQAVGNVQPYKIEVFAYNAAGDAAPVTLWVWNIPDMSVSQNSPAVELKQDNFTTETINANLSRTLVLTENVNLDTWTPPAAFTGKFYGNGHTVTINGMNAAAEMGLFGVVQGESSANPAIVRDLTVNYETAAGGTVSVTRTAETRFGGIAGRFNEHTRMTNTIVSGKFGITAANASGNHIRAGQMIGDITYTTTSATAEINNVYANLELTVENQSASGNIWSGGIVGDVVITASDSSMNLSNATAVGVVDTKNTVAGTSNSANIIAGGAVGRYRTRAILQDVDVYTKVKVHANNTSTNATGSSTTNLDYVCGGIIGLMSSGEVNNCNFKGEIKFSDTFSTLRQTHVGGLIGAVGTVHNSSNYYGDSLNMSVKVSNSTVYGDLNYQNANTGKTILGGVCAAPNGSSTYRITFNKCEYRDGSIHIEAHGDENIGGFSGDNVQYTTFTNCRTFASLIEIIDTTTTKISSYNVGGFVGLSRSDITGCFSYSPIEITLKRTSASGSGDPYLQVGGFVGRYYNGSDGHTGNPTISNCYSRGSVSVNVDYPGSYYIFAGGFVGRMAGTVRIINSYALGNVLADKINSGSGTVYVQAGGFIGDMSMTSGNGYAIERCFTKGSVTAMANGTSSTYVYAGGLVGNKSTTYGYIRDSAALGASVTVKGGSSRSLGRIISSANNASYFSNNHASSLMTLLPIASYSSNSGTTTPPTDDAAGKDGDVITDSLFYSQNVWTNALAFNTAITSRTNYTDVSDQPWNFSGIGSRGYPLLIGSDGKLLEGQ